jgi:aryl-alcohol dehydrogenase-like predicted oxidoreductase
MYRCHPQTAKLVELVRSKVVGEVRVIEARFAFAAGFDPESRLFKNALAGGGILDVGCYPVSMARLVAGAALGKDFADPVEVKGVAHLGETGVDEYAAAVMRFPGDIVAELATGVTVGRENTVRVIGTQGAITLANAWVANRKTPDCPELTVAVKGGKEPRVVKSPADNISFGLEADAFAAALAAGRREAAPPAMTPADTLGNLRALDAWRDSIGLVYEFEKAPAPVSGRKLARRADAKMKYGRIAGVDLPVSRLIMGVDNQKVAPHAFALFDDYVERGGNVFDCAYVYGGGACEKMLGHWVKTRGVRKDVVILDKGAHTPNCNPEALSRQFKESLERLQMDYVDIYMLHRDNPEVPISEFVDVLNEHKKAGRMRAFGGSNWTLERVAAANEYAKAKGLTGFSAVSNQLSLARMVEPPWNGCLTASDPKSRAWLEQTQTALMPWSSQARGFFLPGRANPADRSDKELVKCWYSDENFQRLERVNKLAAERGVEPINVALAWVLAQPLPTFPLFGPRQISETASSFRALAIELTPREVKWLNLES